MTSRPPSEDSSSLGALVRSLFSESEFSEDGERFTIRLRDVANFARISRFYASGTGDGARIDVGILTGELGPADRRALGLRWYDDEELLAYATDNGLLSSALEEDGEEL